MDFLRCFEPLGSTSSTPRPAVVAEMSGNHGGDLDRALAIVDAVAASGAELVKLQTYTADTLTIDVDLPQFRVADSQRLWRGRRLYELYEEASTPWEWHRALFDRARAAGLTPFSSPFDPSAIQLLEDLGCELYKLASAEIVDLPLIKEIAATNKPLVVSTGMATLSEIDAAMNSVRSAGNDRVVLLACTAAYPAAAEDARLANIELLRQTFSVPVGLSDHTLGVGVPIAAVALGAVMLEKHVTLSRDDGSVDSQFSLTPVELQTLVEEAERAWQATSGPPVIGPLAAEEPVWRLRRSLYVVTPVEAGDIVSRSNVRSIRPSGGLPPGSIDVLLGRRFAKSVPAGTPLTWDLV